MERRIVGAWPPSSLIPRRPLSTSIPTSVDAERNTTDTPSTLETQQQTSVSNVSATLFGALRGSVRNAGPPLPSLASSPTYAHLSDLPPGTTRVDIVKAMMTAGPTGRILAMTLTPAGQGRNPLRVQASIEFDSYPSADRLCNLARGNRFVVNGVRPHIKLQIKRANSERGPSVDPAGRPRDQYKDTVAHSRVLLLKGRSDDPRLEVSTIRRLLRGHDVPLDTEMVEVKDYKDGGWRVITWRFCSWRYQARLALKILRTEISCQQGRFPPVKISYEHDPCALKPSELGPSPNKKGKRYVQEKENSYVQDQF